MKARYKRNNNFYVDYKIFTKMIQEFDVEKTCVIPIIYKRTLASESRFVFHTSVSWFKLYQQKGEKIIVLSVEMFVQKNTR